LTRSLRTYVAADLVDKLDRLLHNLTSFTLRAQLVQVKGKIGESLFVPVSEFIHSFKRKVGRTATKVSKKRQQVVLEPVDPTKPSQLATVAPWERDAIHELYEEPWARLQTLIQAFDKTPGLDRNYNEFVTNIRDIVEKQWELKQKILRRTRKRLEIVPEDIGKELWKKLNWIRDYLNTASSLEGLKADELSLFDPYSLIGRVDCLDPTDGFNTNLFVLHKTNKLDLLFPQAELLLSQWDIIIQPAAIANSDGG